MGHDHQPDPPADPELDDLRRLRQEVAAAAEEHGHVLKTPAARMADGSTWTGKTTARNFTAELSGRADELPRHFAQILEALDEEIKQREPRPDHTGGAHV